MALVNDGLPSSLGSAVFVTGHLSFNFGLMALDIAAVQLNLSAKTASAAR